MMGFVKEMNQSVHAKQGFMPYASFEVLQAALHSRDPLKFGQNLGLKTALMISPLEGKLELYRSPVFEQHFKIGTQDNKLVQFFSDKDKIEAYWYFIQYTNRFVEGAYNTPPILNVIYDNMILKLNKNGIYICSLVIYYH